MWCYDLKSNLNCLKCNIRHIQALPKVIKQFCLDVFQELAALSLNAYFHLWDVQNFQQVCFLIVLSVLRW